MKESVKRQRTKVKDPITGESWWEWKAKITIRYEEEEKLPIILEVLKGEHTPEELTEKYHICSVQTLLAWVGRYLTEENSLTLRDKPKSGEDSVTQKPIAGGLLLSRARFLFGFQCKVNQKKSQIAIAVRQIITNFAAEPKTAVGCPRQEDVYRESVHRNESVNHFSQQKETCKVNRLSATVRVNLIS